MSLGLCAHATTLQFINRCGHSIQLVRTENGKNSALQADLAAGNGQTTADFTSGGMNFKVGVEVVLTLKYVSRFMVLYDSML